MKMESLQAELADRKEKEGLGQSRSQLLTMLDAKSQSGEVSEEAYTYIKDDIKDMEG